LFSFFMVYLRPHERQLPLTQGVLMIPILTVTDLRKIYSKAKKAAVDGISFALNKGEILGLLGPNGSGKTTTIQMLLGTLSSSEGSIEYFGKNFEKHRSEVLQEVTYASAYTSLPWALTVQENLEVFGRLYGCSPSVSAKKYEPLLERFGIRDKRSSRISSLSAGQVTRLMLVKAFFLKPRIVLLDEPTASLDPEMAEGICEFILEQRELTGVSILFTSHKMDEAAKLCDRVIFLKDGKLIANDLPKNLALTVSSYRVRLSVIDGMKRAVALAQKKDLAYAIEGRTIEVALSEETIPSFLGEIVQAEITFASISIQEPCLEDYFRYIARSS
jgi:ABC-2 type transport system ATP-binding protein